MKGEGTRVTHHYGDDPVIRNTLWLVRYTHAIYDALKQGITVASTDLSGTLFQALIQVPHEH